MSVSFKKSFHRHLQNIHSRMRERLRTQDVFLNSLMRYAAQGKGKQLRIQMTLLAAQTCGQVTDKVESLAAAMELFHYATLMHDDVIDQARHRRHHLSMNQRYGNEIAVLSGDFLFTQVMQILFEDASRKVQAMVVRAAGRVCLGEIQERQYRRVLDMRIGQYRQVIENKTASLFAACCSGGAETAGGSRRAVERLEAFGLAYGMAFQIQDDILDCTGDSEKTGKPVGQDLKEGRMTLPILLGLERSRGMQKKILQDAVKTGRFKIPGIQKILRNCGAIQESGAVAQMFVASAKQQLDSFPDTQPRRMLADLADAVVNRER